MNQGKLVFAQLMQHLPLTTFRRCVTRYRGERKVKSFSCLDQFLCMALSLADGLKVFPRRSLLARSTVASTSECGD